MQELKGLFSGPSLPQIQEISCVFFSGDYLIYYRNNNNNKAKTAVKMVVDMVYLHENWWEREGSLQGIEPPVRGQRPKTDQRLVLHLQLLLCACECQENKPIKHLMTLS